MNIFGGIVDCATIAKGIIGACKEITLSLPIVVRLEGTSLISRFITIDNASQLLAVLLFLILFLELLVTVIFICNSSL